MMLLYVPAGEFLMGSADSDSQAISDEKPQHTVYLDAFWIDQTEITNAMYELCVQAGACRQPGDTGYFSHSQYRRYPVVDVAWDDAKAYCSWAGRKLPTEAQWEKAARGKDGRSYPWGEGITCDKANYGNCVGHQVNVGSYPAGASPNGALDMAGNVFEWVADWFNDSYYSVSPPSNPLGPDSGQIGALRGGTWGYDANNVRVARRQGTPRDARHDNLGFRCSR